MATATVSKKGWVVIPKAVRDELRMSAGTKVRVYAVGSVAVVEPVPDDPIEAAQRVFAAYGGPSLVDDIIGEHKRELEREERRVYEYLRAGQLGGAGAATEGSGR